METLNQNQEQKLQPNREHKNSVFSLLFSDPDTLRELYSAIEGVPLSPEIPISINTLTDVLIKGKINDISFMIDNRLVVLIEHDSLRSSSVRKLIIYAAKSGLYIKAPLVRICHYGSLDIL